VSLRDFIETLDAAEDVDDALLDRITSEAGQRSGELRDAIRYCAIPRRFDAEVIGVLRGITDDAPGNAELLGELLNYSFVRPREHGGFVYHDSVRGRLLAEWQSGSERSRFEELTSRLVGHFEAVHAKASQAADDAARVNRIIRRVSPARLGELAEAVERGLLEPLIEAAYQLSLLSPAAALDVIPGYLEQFEDRERYTTARALVAATRDIVLGVPPDDEQQSALAWLAYWDGRLLRSMDRFGEAESVLAPLVEWTAGSRSRPLADIATAGSSYPGEVAGVSVELLIRSAPGQAPGRASAGNNDQLRFWTLGELTMALRSCFKLRDALATSEAEVELGERTQVDPLNLPLSYLRLGAIYLDLEDPAQAAAYARKAIESARSEGDPWPMFWALCSLAVAELGEGERDRAFATAIAALDLARTQMRDRRGPHVALSEFFAGWFASEDPALLDTTHKEGDELASALNDAAPGVQRRIARVGLLRRSGQLTRADKALSSVTREVDESDSDLLRANLAIEAGELDFSRGRLGEALERFESAEAAADRSGLPQVAIDARFRRAQMLARLGRSREAEADFEDAAERWREHGHDIRAALADRWRAMLLRRRGGADADQLAAQADASASQGSAEMRADFLEARGEHEAAAGRWEAGRAARVEAASRRAATRRWDKLARLHADLAELAAAEGRWNEAAREADEAVRAWRVLAEHERYERSPGRKRSDEQNAEGVRGLLSGDMHALEGAREALRAAVQSEPTDAWYRLNLSYAAAAAGDWADAVDALEEALAHAPRLRCDTLERRRGEYHAARGQGWIDRAQYEAAAESFRGSLGILTGPAHESARVRCLIGLGDSLRALGDEGAAAAAYREAEEQADGTATIRLGDLLAAMGHTSDAVDAYRRGVRSHESDVAIEAALRLISTGVSQSEVGSVVETVAAVSGPAAVLAVGDGITTMNEEAAAFAYRIAERDVPVASIRLGDLLQSLNDPGGARAAYERGLASGEGEIAAAAALRLSELLVGEGDVDEAERALRSGLALADPPNAPSLHLKIGQLVAGSDASAAELHLRTAAETGDVFVSSEAWYELGDLLAANGRGLEARDCYWRALRLQDAETSARAGFRLVMLSSDHPDGELDEVVAAVLRTGAQAALQLGDALVERGERGIAERVYREAAGLAGDLFAPDASLRLGAILQVSGSMEEARQAYRQALASVDPTVAPEAAVALHDLGEPTAATVDRVIALGGLAALRVGNLLKERGDNALAERAFERLGSNHADRDQRS
jgi:tetratricopeptide (TPR) repeat protein